MQDSFPPASSAPLTLEQALDLAGQHFAAGKMQQTAGICQQILLAMPRQTDALHLLGLAAHRLGKGDAALNLIAQAIAIQPAAAYYHSLGTILQGLGRLEDAERSYRSALALQPVFPEAHYHLGLLQQERGQSEQAMASYRSALKARPEFAQAHNNLGNVLKEMARFHHAAASYREALRLNPGLVEAHNNLGLVLQWQGEPAQAEASYRAALQHDPDFVEAHVQLGTVLQASGQTEAALASYDAALALNPDHDNARHHADALRQVTTAQAPAGYVKTLFDGLAASFDHHLVDTLGYRVPEILTRTIVDRMQPAPGTLDFIDLGCGTGLVGRHMKPFCRRLSGVDLSARMIDQARAKEIYSELTIGDVNTYLASAPDTSADLIIAADVFIYIGDLQDLFRQAKRVLRPGGAFGFSIETAIGAKTDYALQPSGRYAHSLGYIGRLARQEGLREAFCSPVVIRFEGGKPVNGHICLQHLP